MSGAENCRCEPYRNNDGSENGACEACEQAAYDAVWGNRDMLNELHAAPQESDDDMCPDCGGAGERFDHAYDCDNDTCALNGDIDSCNGQVVPCHCCPEPIAQQMRRDTAEGRVARMEG